MATVHDLTAKRLDGTMQALSDYRGQVLLIVNVASECGFTPQYEGLEQLQKSYADRGFQVLGFPCNQFGNQEPGSAEAIASFCTSRFGVSFPMFAKIDVNGEDAHPVFALLKSAAPGVLGTTAIKWNFTKFLVGRDGRVLGRYAPNTVPAALRAEIEAALDDPPSA